VIYIVRSPFIEVEAETPEEAVEKARKMWAAGDPLTRATTREAVLKALEFYADPDSYFAVAILGDAPYGAFGDDIGCVIGPHEDHDHRHGRHARRALGNEWWGTEPCDKMLEAMKEEETQ
jgi:hypothetical protein